MSPLAWLLESLGLEGGLELMGGLDASSEPRLHTPAPTHIHLCGRRRWGCCIPRAGKWKEGGRRGRNSREPGRSPSSLQTPAPNRSVATGSLGVRARQGLCARHLQRRRASEYVTCAGVGHGCLVRASWLPAVFRQARRPRRCCQCGELGWRLRVSSGVPSKCDLWMCSPGSRGSTAQSARVGEQE